MRKHANPSRDHAASTPHTVPINRATRRHVRYHPNAPLVTTHRGRFRLVGTRAQSSSSSSRPVVVPNYLRITPSPTGGQK